MDANYQEVHLLSPMYLTIQIETIPDAEDKQYNVPTNLQSTLTMSSYAYLRDNTERGMSYDIENIGNYIYFEQPTQEQNDQKPQSNNDTKQ